MSEPVWYYARGEVERGPFTSLQIKALAQAGKLRREDLVWKEGMDNWTAAEEVRELFPAEPPSDARPANGTTTAESPPLSRLSALPAPAIVSSDVARLITSTAWGCLTLGLFSVVLARGCESLGERKVARLDAAARLHADEAWEQQRVPLLAEVESLQKKGRLPSAEQDRLRELTQTLNQLDAAYTAEERFAVQRMGANRALAEFRAGAFLRGMAFHGGVAFVTLGGLALALLGAGTDRWLGVGVVLCVCAATLAMAPAK